VDRNLFLISRI